jgi:aspartate-semialdehyde dehydrogenase
MRELVAQWAHLVEAARPMLANPAATALAIDDRLTEAMRDASLPTDNFGHPLAASLLPWIDEPVEGGQTREEWKAFAEGNKILGRREPIPFDGVCVRVGAMRCHAQGVMLKLRRAIPLAQINERIANAHQWVRFVPNDREQTLAELTPAAVSGTLDIAVGRVRTMHMGPEYVSLYTVGDQLLWGAAEPLRRMLTILRDRA